MGGYYENKSSVDTTEYVGLACIGSKRGQLVGFVKTVINIMIPRKMENFFAI
jgi:hypothetical protein